MAPDFKKTLRTALYNSEQTSHLVQALLVAHLELVGYADVAEATSCGDLVPAALERAVEECRTLESYDAGLRAAMSAPVAA